MVDIVAYNIEKYIGYKLNEKEEKALQEVLENPDYEEEAEIIASLLILARINYYVPKILNYFKIYWLDIDTVVLSNKKVEVRVNIMDLIENENKVKNLANALMNFTNNYIGEFTCYAKKRIKKLLEPVKTIKGYFENYDIKIKDDKVIINNNYEIDKEKFDLAILVLSGEFDGEIDR